MPQLRHKVSGIRLVVSDETAARLGSEWEAEGAAKATPAPASRHRKSKPKADDSDE